MKKLLILLLVTSSFVSQGQFFTKFKNLEFDEQKTFSFLMGGNLDMNIDFRIGNYRIGTDLMNTRSYENNKERVGYGLYYVTPSIDGVDLTVGLGFTSILEPREQYQNVSGYYRSSGTYVRSYTRSDGYKMESTSTNLYGLVGIGGNFRYGFVAKGIVRFTPLGVEPNVLIGFSF